MKKLLVLTLMLTMALWAGCAAGEAMVETIIGDYSCRISADNTITIIDYFGKEESVIIPSELDGYPVTGIGDSAFYGADYMTSVTIPDSVTSIGDFAFDYCDNLTSIEIPDSVEYIGSNPFKNYSVNIEIHVSPEHPVLATIDGVLFNKTEKKLICYPLGLTASSYKIPQGIFAIGDAAFFGCDALTSIEIPDSVTSIGDFAFFYCESLTSITIPDSVTDIGDYAFYSCDALTSIEIPDSVISIGEGAFDECPSDLVFMVDRDSYAVQWCKEHGFKYNYLDALDWLNN